ncbi:MAG: hypothetical protein K2X44_11980 [Magnetospirillum sp.]|nr:hypothetical protein [Magnetospirillum sp.]
MAVELAYEKTVLSANRPLLGLLEEFRSSGMVVAAVSDTPLESADLAQLLDHAGAGTPFTRLYASAEIGLTKRDGHLFGHLCRTEGVAPTHILHMGDHPWSDVEMPRRHGYNTLHLPRAPLWRWLHGWRDRRIKHQLRRQGLIP